MNEPAGLPAEKRRLLKRTVEALRRVPGMVAVVLGGSYARGSQHAIKGGYRCQ